LEGDFVNTKELQVIKYKQAVKSKDKEQWDEDVLEEHERMVKISVLLAVPRNEVPPGSTRSKQYVLYLGHEE
jgi:hypothetical protein